MRNQDLTPEQRLWVAVLALTVRDLASRNRRNAEHARRFVASPWCAEVCDFVGVDVDRLRAATTDKQRLRALTRKKGGLA